MKRIGAAIAAALLLVSAISPALSQDISSIKSMLAAKMCPASLLDEISYSSRDCGDAKWHACDRLLYDSGGKECWADLHACQKQVEADNEVIRESNRVYRVCHANGDRGQSSQASKPSGAALAKQAAEAKQKAEEAKTNARQAAEKQEQTKKAAEEQRSRLKVEAAKVPSWCQGLIGSCQQRAASLSNASSGTQSQCNAYCQTLRIENCNGDSPTVQGAAQACNSGAQRDQREASEAAKRHAPASQTNSVPPEGGTKSYCGPGRYLAAGGFYCCPYSERGRPPC
jgi:hypothetical protein